MAGYRFKFASLCLLLAQSALVLAAINVKCSGNFDGEKSDLKVVASGSQVGIVTGAERSTFGIHDSNMKHAASIEFGRPPDYIYAKSPTPPWGDLYETYGWSQVSRTLVTKSGKILAVTSKPTIVTEQVFANNSSYTAKFKAEIQQTVQNTVSSSWTKGGELSVGQEINYGFDFALVSAGGTTSFSYTSFWGDNTEKSQSVTVGSSSGIEIELKPQKTVYVQLLATRGTVKLEVEYEASLSGGMAMRFDRRYKNHHFWLMDVNELLTRAGLPSKKTSREVIEIGFYSQSRVIVRDKVTGALLI